ncbi:hypothetical protein HPP92_001347 [Vanilla planifolia]|uniref:Peptidyl-prolyl cis-trans isomerase n=1 Tax=Vanilla planifolia TaxID=51239 RepID=A0A835RZ41_VANPL|nr:hypothetical protein HPP92_001347 [Vanilla planifolia]
MSVTLHTNLGDIKCEIFCDEVPKTAENFLALCASDYYDGTIFHRNIKGFMIQGGIQQEQAREVPAYGHNARGILSMANSGPNTNGSQFFITYAKQPHLNGLLHHLCLRLTWVLVRHYRGVVLLHCKVRTWRFAEDLNRSIILSQREEMIPNAVGGVWLPKAAFPPPSSGDRSVLFLFLPQNFSLRENGAISFVVSRIT